MTYGGWTLHDLSLFLAIGAAVLLVSVASVRLANRSGLPTLLIYLGIGLLLGNNGLGIKFSDAALTQVLGYCALVLILAEGGLTTRWSRIERSVAPAAVLSTLGVLISVGVVGVGAHLILGLGWKISLLLGAIVSSTDAAAVFSVLRSVPLPPRVAGVLEAESGFNDAPVVLLVVALADAGVRGASNPSWWGLATKAAIELSGGAFLGGLIGYALGTLSKKMSPSSSGLYSIGIIAMTVLAYGAADLLHLSGFIAVYVCGLVLGNLNLPHHAAVMGFTQALGWIAQIGLFVLLGLLASPERLGDQLWPAIVIGLVLLLAARPLSVLVSMTPFGFNWREQAFLSWAGLRGAVPVVLATVPFTSGTQHTEWIFDMVFVLVVVFTLIQAPALPRIARWLRIGNEAHTVDVEVESTPLDELRASMVQVRVGERSRLNGVEIHELRLPVGANVTLIVRGDSSFVPQDSSVIRRGDQLLIVTPSDQRDRTAARIEAISRDGRLAGWHRDRRTVADM